MAQVPTLRFARVTCAEISSCLPRLGVVDVTSLLTIGAVMVMLLQFIYYISCFVVIYLSVYPFFFSLIDQHMQVYVEFSYYTFISQNS